jgi:2-polyprenyl-3-methyl-5-hydroxy-6-metoxy-1,4-benzoquinol methylase
MPTDTSPPDPRLDVVAATVDLGGRRLAYVHPRDATALPPEDDPGGGAAYPPHWAEPWPSGIALAQAVAEGDWRGTAVLELGCGLGLPSVAAALAGAHVLASDRSADAVAFAAVNAECNGVAVETAVCAWDAADVLVGSADRPDGSCTPRRPRAQPARCAPAAASVHGQERPS